MYTALAIVMTLMTHLPSTLPEALWEAAREAAVETLSDAVPLAARVLPAVAFGASCDDGDVAEPTVPDPRTSAGLL